MARKAWLSAIVLVACTPGTKGSGTSVTDKREVAPFTRVRASGGLPVKIGVGNNPRLEITGDDNIVPLISSKVEEGELRLEYTKQGGFRPVAPLRIEVVTATLTAVSASGGTSVELTAVHRSTFAIDASGGTSITAFGEVGALEIDASGGATLHTTALRAQRIHLRASGGVSAKLFASEAIEGKVSGGVSIDVAGNPPVRNIAASGGASLTYR